MRYPIALPLLFAAWSTLCFGDDISVDLEASNIKSSELSLNAGGIKSVVTWAKTSISEYPSLEPRFISSDIIHSDGNSFYQTIPVMEGAREVPVQYSRGADCVAESFILHSTSASTQLITSSRHYGLSKEIIPQTEPTRQLIKIYVLVTNTHLPQQVLMNGTRSYVPQSYFKLKDSRVSASKACSDQEVNDILLSFEIK